MANGKDFIIDGLNLRQSKFVRAYVKLGNATHAAIEAGYSKKTAEVAGSKQLSNSKVQAALKKYVKPHLDRYEVTTARVLEELASIAFANMSDVAEWDAGSVNLIKSDTLSARIKSAVAEVGQTITKGGGSLRIKMHDKVAALAILSKFVGIEKSPNDPDNIEDDEGNTQPTRAVFSADHADEEFQKDYDELRGKVIR